MTTVCMVLHAEGPGDLGSPARQVPPGESLMLDEQGPVHILVRRILAEGAQIPENAIDFREPLRTQTGVRAYGSKLLDTQILDEILAGWLLSEPIVVFLIDADDSSPQERKDLLVSALSRNDLTGAVGVAVKEFEAWLIADPAALKTVLEASQNSPSKPEDLEPGKAKQLLSSWSGNSPNRDPLDLRKELVSIMDLDKVSAQCSSFKEFRAELSSLQFS
ncbi:MAG: DUF4276 family protein [Cyanobacteria bacterium P01_F01_bin.42]